MTWTLKMNIAVAGALRLLLICYGRIHDAVFDVRFTDIDYIVFTDAARHVTDGQSPYDRSTYRYSPIIAWILTPSIWWGMFEFGKLLFTIMDLISAMLVYAIVIRDTKGDDWKGTLSACFILYNPLTAIISARGNAESLISLLVLLVIYLLPHHGSSSPWNWILASIIHGLAIHLKIYPLIYLPSLFFHFSSLSHHSSLKALMWSFFTNYRGFFYGLFCCIVFSSLTFIFYLIYGSAFLNEALLYHVSRRDIKHNFSPYFYPLYLSQDNPNWNWVSSAAFVPQLLLILLFSFQYANDLPFCWFICTFAFVSFNKVCTSQYFMWYLSLLPLIWYKLRLDLLGAATMFSLWTLAQAVWLCLAYLLEFKGWNVFLAVWMASLAFLIVNCWVLARIRRAYNDQLNVKEVKHEKIS